MVATAAQEVKPSFSSSPLGRAIKNAGASILAVVSYALTVWLADSNNVKPLLDLLISSQTISAVVLTAIVGWAGRKSKENGKDLKII